MSTAKAMTLSILSAIGICAVIAGIWALTVVLSGPTGSGGVHKDRNNAKNREHWSAVYNTDWSNLQADKVNIQTLFVAAHTASSTPQDDMNLTGAVLNCTMDVATYNADAHNTLGTEWLPDTLPGSVNVSDYCDTTNLAPIK